MARPTASQLRLLADVAAGYVYRVGGGAVYLNDPVVGVLPLGMRDRVVRLKAAGWVELAPKPDGYVGTRRYYRLTDAGRAVRERARAELRAGAS
jgi:hypothetical protein